MGGGELPDRFYLQASRTRRLNVILKELAKEEIFTKALKHRELMNLWQEITGEEIYKQTRIVEFKKGCLTIGVDSAALLHHLANFCKEDILRGLQTRYKGPFVTSLRFRLSASTEDLG
jgi:predicted nucleic acid-binding Zn ribbon protein